MGYTRICDRLITGERKGLKRLPKDIRKEAKAQYKEKSTEFYFDKFKGSFDKLVVAENKINGKDDFVDLANYEIIETKKKRLMGNNSKGLSLEAKAIIVALMWTAVMFGIESCHQKTIDAKQNVVTGQIELGK